MKFKEPQFEDQLNKSPKKLQEIVIHFEDLSRQFGIEPTITRVWDPVAGDSGVHECHRGVDLRDEYEDASGNLNRLYTYEQVNYITTTLNNFYPRTDGHFVCIHHSFQGHPMHFHLQIPAIWVDRA